MTTCFERFNLQFPSVVKALKRAQEQGRLAHSYLLHADDEKVRCDAPLAIAQLVSCRSLLIDGSPCGKCSICEAIEAKNYAELFQIMPVSKSRQIKVGDNEEDTGTMRWFYAQFYYASTSNNSIRIGVIYDADCLNDSAQNAFLKTLEEPPAQTLFMLVTAHPSRLLPTIRSRCQQLNLLLNKCIYTQPFIPQLVAILHELRFDCTGNLARANRCAEALLELASTLKKTAEAKQEFIWASQMEQLKDGEWDRSEKKQLEERLEGAIASEYLSLREAFTQAIYDYFALAYQLALGVDECVLHNPELRVKKTDQNKMLSEALARKHLQLAEKFVSMLKYNVNETLLIRTFALEIAFAKEG